MTHTQLPRQLTCINSVANQPHGDPSDKLLPVPAVKLCN